MSKGLEALGRITGTQNLTMYEQDMCLKTIEEELKAVEIIKKKKVNVNRLLIAIKSHDKNNGKWQYNRYVVRKDRQLTQEEYDLLKEVML